MTWTTPPDHAEALKAALYTLRFPRSRQEPLHNVSACYLDLLKTQEEEKAILLEDFISSHGLSRALGACEATFIRVFPPGSTLERFLEQAEDGEQHLVLRVIFYTQPDDPLPEDMGIAYKTWRTMIFAALDPKQMALVSLMCQPFSSSPGWSLNQWESHYPPTVWEAFAWMLRADALVKKCRSYVYRAQYGGKAHVQNKIDAAELEPKLREMFPYSWERPTP